MLYREYDTGEETAQMEGVSNFAACRDECVKNKDCDTFVYIKSETKDCFLYKGARLKKGSQVLFGNNVGGWCPGKGETQVASTSHKTIDSGKEFGLSKLADLRCNFKDVCQARGLDNLLGGEFGCLNGDGGSNPSGSCAAGGLSGTWQFL